MSKRKSRKTRSKRGSRTHGGGNTKKRRHSGNKGGKGLAGSDKHLKRDLTQKNPKYFGKYGFKRPPALRDDKDTINVGEIDEYVDEFLERDLAVEEGGEIVVNVSELGFDKVLGGGQVKHSLKVIADSFSGTAEEKLEESGGTAETGED